MRETCCPCCRRERQFDFVLSNPPYVSESEFAELPLTVRDFEPRTALVAGPRGDEVVERLLPQAAARLKAGGWLIMEISPMIEVAGSRSFCGRSGVVATPAGQGPGKTASRHFQSLWGVKVSAACQPEKPLHPHPGFGTLVGIGNQPKIREYPAAGEQVLASCRWTIRPSSSLAAGVPRAIRVDARPLRHRRSRRPPSRDSMAATAVEPTLDQKKQHRVWRHAARSHKKRPCMTAVSSIPRHNGCNRRSKLEAIASCQPR